MVYFHTKIAIWYISEGLAHNGIFWYILNHLEYITTTWYIVWTFGNFVIIWYIFPVLVYISVV
jgi:hypothetical protein